MFDVTLRSDGNVDISWDVAFNNLADIVLDDYIVDSSEVTLDSEEFDAVVEHTRALHHHLQSIGNQLFDLLVLDFYSALRKVKPSVVPDINERDFT